MVSEKRKISKSTYIALLSYTTLIFVIGIVIGWWFSNNQLSQSKYDQEKLRAILSGVELKNQLIEQELACNFSVLGIFEDKTDLGRRVTILEARMGKDNPNVLIEKEIYQLVEIRTWSTLKKIKEVCNQNYTLILYFYSNNKDDDLAFKQSEDQGFILDEVYLRNKNSLITFSFDIHNDNPAIKTIKDIYNIKSAPSLVINDVTYPGFKTYNELKNIINDSQ